MSLDFAGFAPGGNQNFSFPDAGTMFYDFDNTQHGADFLNEGLFVNTPIAPWVSSSISRFCHVSNASRALAWEQVMQHHHYITWAITSWGEGIWWDY